MGVDPHRAMILLVGAAAVKASAPVAIVLFRCLNFSLGACTLDSTSSVARFPKSRTTSCAMDRTTMRSHDVHRIHK